MGGPGGDVPYYGYPGVARLLPLQVSAQTGKGNITEHPTLSYTHHAYKADRRIWPES